MDTSPMTISIYEAQCVIKRIDTLLKVPDNSVLCINPHEDIDVLEVFAFGQVNAANELSFKHSLIDARAHIKMLLEEAIHKSGIYNLKVEKNRLKEQLRLSRNVVKHHHFNEGLLTTTKAIQHEIDTDSSVGGSKEIWVYTLLPEIVADEDARVMKHKVSIDEIKGKIQSLSHKIEIELEPSLIAFLESGNLI